MALSIGFRIFSFLPSCYSSYGALNFYPGGTFTHCSCQPSLDAHFSFRIASTGGTSELAASCGEKAISFVCDHRRVLSESPTIWELSVGGRIEIPGVRTSTHCISNFHYVLQQQSI